MNKHTHTLHTNVQISLTDFVLLNGVYFAGETVESIQQAQRVMDYKKSIIPQPLYSANVYKKDTIPEPPSPQVSFSKTTEKKSKVKTNKSKNASKTSKTAAKTSKKSTDSKSQRQYIPQYQFQQQYGPYIANYQQQNPFSMQQSVVQYTAPQSSAQVQNMDGMHTRPLITGTVTHLHTHGRFLRANFKYVTTYFYFFICF